MKMDSRVVELWKVSGDLADGSNNHNVFQVSARNLRLNNSNVIRRRRKFVITVQRGTEFVHMIQLRTNNKLAR